jgi:hypothetical protein
MDTEYIQRGVKDAIRGNYNRNGMSGERLDSYWVGHTVCRTMMDNMPPVAQSPRPDPSRAEMAMRLYPTLLRNFDETVRRGECGYTPGWREGIADDAVKHADALIAALARKEKP